MIRNPYNQDIKSLLEIESESFASHCCLGYRQFYYLINHGKGFFYIATVRNKVVGYIYASIKKNVKYVRIYSIAVAKEYRHKGIATALLHHLEQQVRRHTTKFKGIKLEVATHNHKAIRFYKSQGYVKFNMVADYYRQGEDAYKFKKDFFAA